MKELDIHQQYSQGKVFLVDVRSPLEFRQGHIPGSQNIPLEKILSGDTTLPNVEDKQLGLVCQSGKRAKRAELFLAEQKGIQAVILEGGMDAWQAKGLPVEKDAATHGVSLIRQVQIIIGGMNLIALALAWFVSPYWLLLPACTSTGLLLAGLTGFCGLALVLGKMPWNRA